MYGKKDSGRKGRPFQEHWIDSCYQQTLLPDTPWQKVMFRMGRKFADRISKQFSHEERKQVLLQLLGKEFIKVYFPDEVLNPPLLEPPNMTTEKRNKLFLEAQSWLQNQLNKAAKEAGCQRGQSEEEMVDEMKDFLQHTYNIFYKGLDRQLYKQEQELAVKQKNDMVQEKKKEKKLENEKAKKLPPLVRLNTGQSSNSSVGSFADKLSVTNLRTSLHTLHRQNMPVSQGPASNLIGDGVIKILQRDPRRMDEVVLKLKGRQLPGTLRRYIWLDILLKNERERMKDANVEKIVRERFGRMVAKNVGNMRLKRATQSPISGLIDNAVIEMYENTTCMLAYYNESHMKEAARALNVLYVYDRSYEPYLIHWLFPLQLAFKADPDGDPLPAAGEHVYELAMYLDLLNIHAFPPWPRVFNIADNVMTRLRIADEELYNHLTTISQKNNNISKKDFLVYLIQKEKSQAEEMVEDSGSPRSRQSSEELLADPIIFLRKWVGEAFVTVLDTQAVMFLWDQCFMQYWRQHVLEDFCLALLLLLKHKFFQAKDFIGMKKVFLDEPCKLYTMDIQSGWEVLDNEGDVTLISGMNRQNPKAKLKVKPPVIPPTPKSRASIYGDDKVVPPIGLKDVGLKLVLSKEAINREAALLNFNLRCIRLTVMAFFGSVHLDTRVSQTWAQARGDNIDGIGSKTYNAEFSKESFIFDDIDVTKYDLEREMGGEPFAIVKVDYMKGRTAVPLGWSRVLLHTHKSSTNTTATQFGSQTWHVVGGTHKYDINPGEDPQYAKRASAQTTRRQPLGYLGDGSILTVRLFEGDEAGGRKPPMKGKTPPPMHPEDIWIDHTPSAAADNPAPSSSEQSFDIYIDGVNFIPDNATIVKVTGRLVRTGDVTDLPDILALPELQSSARSPRFKFRFNVNGDGKKMDANAVAFLRVYTVDYNTKSLVVVGSCLLKLFDQEGNLLVGGHQLKLKFGMPDLKKGIASLRSTDLDSAHGIPGTSLLVRLLPRSIDFRKAPGYGSGYYKSRPAQPNPSERKTMHAFNDDLEFPGTVDEMILDLQRDENVESEVDHVTWMTERLDNVRHLSANTPAGNLPWFHTLRYREDVGFNVNIARAYGLPENLYINCLGRLSLGIDSSEYFDATTLEPVATFSHDYDRLQKSPKWLDSAQTMTPPYDLNTTMVITLLALDVKYIPTKNHDAVGTVQSTTSKRDPVTFKTVGWTVMPLFDSNAAYAGEHHLPVFKGEPPANLIEEMKSDDVEDVLGRQEWTIGNKYESAGLVVHVWDGLYGVKDLPPLDLHDELMGLVGDVTLYEDAENDTTGKHMTQLIIDSLDKKAQKEGTTGAIYQKERLFYEQAMGEIYSSLLDGKVSS